MLLKQLSLLLCLLFTGAATAQTGTESKLLQNFTQYHNQVLQEKLFVHTDCSDYLAGETIWFKLYAVDGTHHKPLDFSRVAYLELLDKQNKPVLQAKVALENSFGNGSFYLPLSLQSGNYKMRAYTAWMKNFSPDFYFEKAITLVNTFTNPDLGPLAETASLDVQFFPEGGDLVDGIQSKVAFKAVDKKGAGVAIKGAVIKETGDTVALIESLKFGMGHFYFKPEAGVTYKAVVSHGTNSVQTFALPAARQQGWVLHVDDTGGEQLNITVSSTFPDESILLFIHTRHEAKLAGTAKLNKGQLLFKVNKKDLGEGISHITLFNQQQQAVAERLYFRYPQNTLNIATRTNASHYTPRQKVEVEISTTGKDNMPVPANLSMAVYHTGLLTGVEGSNILSYLWLSSDLRGNIESPSYYFNATGPEAKEALNNLLLTQGWRRFSWQDIVQQQKPLLSYIPEYEGHLIQAVVKEDRSEAPAEGITYYLSVPGKQPKVYAATSNKQGQILFNTERIFGLRNVVLKNSSSNAQTPLNISITNPYSSQYSSAVLPSLGLSGIDQNLLELRHIQMQTQNIYWRDEKSRFKSPS